jgi:hypothetical protein
MQARSFRAERLPGYARLNPSINNLGTPFEKQHTRADAAGDPPIGFGGTPLSGLPPYDGTVRTLGRMPKAIRRLVIRWNASSRLPPYGDIVRIVGRMPEAIRRLVIRWNASSRLPPYEDNSHIVGRMPEAIRRWDSVERPIGASTLRR